MVPLAAAQVALDIDAPELDIDAPELEGAAKALDTEQTMALLHGVLDDLGAAHHRPFSRE